MCFSALWYQQLSSQIYAEAWPEADAIAIARADADAEAQPFGEQKKRGLLGLLKKIKERHQQFITHLKNKKFGATTDASETTSSASQTTESSSSSTSSSSTSSSESTTPSSTSTTAASTTAESSAGLGI